MQLNQCGCVGHRTLVENCVTQLSTVAVFVSRSTHEGLRNRVRLKSTTAVPWVKAC